MRTARDIMTPAPRIVDMSTSVIDIAKTLESEEIGAVIVCNSDRRLQGMITDRDLAVQVVGAGRDPHDVSAGDIVGEREVVTIGADDSIDLAVSTMKEHAVRRLPVIDGTDVIGIVSQADVARHLDGDQVGEMVESISEARDNTARG